MTPSKCPSMPEPSVLFLEAPLYKKFKLNTKKAFELLNFKGSLDMYCLDCGKISVFNPDIAPHPTPAQIPAPILGRTPLQISIPVFFEICFRCAHDKSHVAIFYFKTDNNSICKIGEYPSVADISSNELQTYQKILGKELSSLEFAKVLHSQNYGAGSFVYLRRIFENIIVKRIAKRKYKDDQGWDYQTWKSAQQSMKDTLKELANELPDFINNQELFRVLSAAVHELDEESCLQHFPTVEKAIIEILDNEIENDKKQQRRRSLNNEIKKIDRSLKK